MARRVVVARLARARGAPLGGLLIYSVKVAQPFRRGCLGSETIGARWLRRGAGAAVGRAAARWPESFRFYPSANLARP